MTGSRRTTPLPPDWHVTRPRILERDGHRCQWLARAGKCGERATDVDHITPAHLGGTDEDSNLAALCRTHHNRKSSAEAGRAAQAKRIPRRRPAERHPGLRS